jgi:hypothetical protein
MIGLLQQPVQFQPVAQYVAADAEQFGRLQLVVFTVLEGAAHHALFDIGIERIAAAFKYIQQCPLQRCIDFAEHRADVDFGNRAGKLIAGIDRCNGHALAANVYKRLAATLASDIYTAKEQKITWLFRGVAQRGELVVAHPVLVSTTVRDR